MMTSKKIINLLLILAMSVALSTTDIYAAGKGGKGGRFSSGGKSSTAAARVSIKPKTPSVSVSRRALTPTSSRRAVTTNRARPAKQFKNASSQLSPWSQASKLSGKIQKNSVTAKTGGGKIVRYDLKSNPQRKGSHYNSAQQKSINTPHKHVIKIVGRKDKAGNVYKNRVEEKNSPRAMTSRDVRTARKITEKRNRKK